SYLDEILSKRFDEQSPANGIPPCWDGATSSTECTEESAFGPDAGESRETYDDVDDYHGLTEGQGYAYPLRDALGIERQGYEGYRVEIQVRYLQSGAGEAEEGFGIGTTALDAKL